LTEPQKSSGVKETVRCITFETASTDAAGDIKALFRVGAHEIPIEGWLISDAIAGATRTSERFEDIFNTTYEAAKAAWDAR
jgi:hypothetical protein